MRNAVADIPESQVEKRSPRSSAIPAQAIRRAFPFEGDLRVRHLWSQNGTARYRANWFGHVDGAIKVVKSLFLSVTRAEDGLVVQNETVVR